MKEKQCSVSCVYAKGGQTAAGLLEASFRAFLKQELAVPGRSGKQ